jgi:hypothetical protein
MRCPVRETRGRHRGGPGPLTSRDREGESTRRPERAPRPEGRLRPRAAMHRGGGDSMECALRPAAGDRNRRQKRAAESHAHREGDELPSHHPPTPRYNRSLRPSGDLEQAAPDRVIPPCPPEWPERWPARRRRGSVAPPRPRRTYSRSAGSSALLVDPLESPEGRAGPDIVAPRARWRAAIAPPRAADGARAGSPGRLGWARWLRRVFPIQVLVCQRCGARGGPGRGDGAP